MPNPPLAPEQLRRACDAARFDFDTTATVAPLAERIGQDRALEAVRFGVSMRHEGYNLFAMGPPGSGKLTVLRRVIEERAAEESTPDDVCYVHDFARPHKPRALRLPQGVGQRLKKDVEQLVEELRAAIPGALEGEQFGARKQALVEEIKEQADQDLAAFRKKAEAKNVGLVHTPMGFALAPTKGGEIVKHDAFQKLPDEERKQYEQDIEELGAELRGFIEQMPRREAEAQRRVKALVRDTLMAAVGHLLDDLEKRYEAFPEVVAHLRALGLDVLENVPDFLKPEDGAALMPLADLAKARGGPFRRYQVNLLVDHSESKGAPVVWEDHPSYDNLVGRVEHLSQLGALVTDFNLVKAGALHRANGGYLLLDARNLLMQPYAWEGLKRALEGRQIRIESIGQWLGLVSTVSLEPEPVPLAVKVVLLGDRRLFYLLEQLEPSFASLFKVVVDFEDEVPRDEETERAYARLLATVARDEGLRPFERGAVARVVEQAARWAGHAGRLSTHMGTLVDLAREADHAASEARSKLVAADHVDAAVRAQERRAGRIRDRVQDEIREGTLLVETSGERVGQINGLSVIQLGRFAFGRPSRITAKVRLGKGEVVDIEREVELGGPIHSKGVLILSSFLGSRYARDLPLSLSASLVFEQSYGMIEGDSASSTELYALLSALAEAPIRQSFAVTGSVNQHGEVQAIGGANEKIEGFFDLCSARGLTGEQGVLVPASNVPHLMLRPDVVEAVRKGRFGIHAVATIDEGIELLTGLPAGERDAAGKFPEGSINERVERRLAALAKLRLELGAAADKRKGDS